MHDFGEFCEILRAIFTFQSSGCVVLIPPPHPVTVARAADPCVAPMCTLDVLCAHAGTFAGSLAWQARGFDHSWRLNDTTRTVRACARKASHVPRAL